MLGIVLLFSDGSKSSSSEVLVLTSEIPRFLSWAVSYKWKHFATVLASYWSSRLQITYKWIFVVAEKLTCANGVVDDQIDLWAVNNIIIWIIHMSGLTHTLILFVRAWRTCTNFNTNYQYMYSTLWHQILR